MALKVVGIAYPKIAIASVKYQKLRATSFDLWERHLVMRLRDTSAPTDNLKVDAFVKPRDGVLVREECLIGDPPFEERVPVAETFGVYIEFKRLLADEVPVSADFGMEITKYFYDAVSVEDSFRSAMEVRKKDTGGTRDEVDYFTTVEKRSRDTTAPREKFVKNVESRKRENTTPTDRLRRTTDKDSFTEQIVLEEASAFSFQKGLRDTTAPTDSVSITITRSASATYGLAVFGGTTFGG